MPGAYEYSSRLSQHEVYLDRSDPRTLGIIGLAEGLNRVRDEIDTGSQQELEPFMQQIRVLREQTGEIEARYGEQVRLFVQDFLTNTQNRELLQVQGRPDGQIGINGLIEAFYAGRTNRWAGIWIDANDGTAFRVASRRSNMAGSVESQRSPISDVEWFRYREPILNGVWGQIRHGIERVNYDRFHNQS